MECTYPHCSCKSTEICTAKVSIETTTQYYTNTDLSQMIEVWLGKQPAKPNILPSCTYKVRPMPLHVISKGEGWVTANYEGCKPFVEKEAEFIKRLIFK